ncbi:hypothetical protein L195_g056623, partial [Trifolium pratense]
MYRAFEERLKVVEGFSVYGVDAMNMCLILDVAIPPKFNVPDLRNTRGSTLERSQIQTWKDLDAFLKQYKYNLDMAPNRMQLQNLSQKSSESFKEYAQRWRELVARVEPSLLEKELVDTFMSTLQGPYYEKMIGSISSGFTDMVIIVERVKEGLKSSKIQDSSSNQVGEKKHFNNHHKKKE